MNSRLLSLFACVFVPLAGRALQDDPAAAAAPTPAAGAAASPAAAVPPPPTEAAPAAPPASPGVPVPVRTNRTAIPRQFPRTVGGGGAGRAAIPAPAAPAPTNNAPATVSASPTVPPPRPVVTPAASTPAPAPAVAPAVTQAAVNTNLPPNAAATPIPAVAPPGVNLATNPDPTTSTNVVILPGGMVKLINMPLDQFLAQVYAKKMGKTILRPSTLQGQPINFEQVSPLTDQELLQAYDSVLALNGISTIPTGDKFITVVPTTQAAQEGAAFSSRGKGDLPEASQYVTTIIQLKHVKPSEIVNALTPFAKNPNNIVALESTSTLVLRDFAINVKRMLEVIEKVDTVVEDDFQLEVIPIRYGRVEDLYQTLSGIISGTGGGAGAGAVGTGASGTFGGGNQGGFGRGSMGGRGGGFGGSSSRYGGSSSYGGYGGSYGGSGSRYGSGYSGGYSGYSNGIEPVPDSFQPQAGDIRPFQTATTPTPSTFQNRLTSANRAAGGAAQKPEHSLVEDARIIPDQRSNKLIVYGSKKDIEQIRKVVDKVDTLLAQVLIEGIVMNVSLNDGWNYGISGGQRPKQFNSTITGGGTVNNTAGQGSNPLNGGIGFLQGALTSSSTNGTLTSIYPAGPGFGYSALLGNRWDLALSAAASDSRIDLIQRPRIITSHSVPARFFVGSQVPYRQGGYSFGGQDSFYYSSLPVGIGIDVTPFLTPDNLVVMEISQNIDAVVGDFNPSSGIPPTTSTREASAVVTVRSGDVILLGGFLDSNKSVGSSGVPLLKDIPLLGNLFKSKSASKSKSELMILVRPTILPKPADVAAYTDQQRMDSGNIQKLEQSFAEDDIRSRTEAERERVKAEEREKKRQSKSNRSKSR